jgi:hypothetical protein
MKQLDNRREFPNQSCRAKAVTADYALVDCLTDSRQCEYKMSFGNGFFCRHPLRKEIVKRTAAGLVEQLAVN